MNAWLDMTDYECDTNTTATPDLSYQLNVNDSVKSLVSHYPETLPVLQALGFDLKGLGWLPLRTVVAEMGLDLATVCLAICNIVAANDPICAAQRTDLDDEDLRYSEEWRMEHAA